VYTHNGVFPPALLLSSSPSHSAELLRRSVAASRPFLAVICFHGVHIPYVATPETRATYPNMTVNEQDYWGTITQIDAAIGRVRGLLQAHDVASNTFVSFTADNGPEVNPAGGQGTGNFGEFSYIRSFEESTHKTKHLRATRVPCTTGSRRVECCVL
jgi:arylsulfatase A-like enzyme